MNFIFYLYQIQLLQHSVIARQRADLIGFLPNKDNQRNVEADEIHEVG